MKSFYSFSDGVPIPSYRVNGWIQEVLDAAKAGAIHHCISSGDTCVSMHVWDNGEIQIDVSNSKGRHRIVFYDGDELEFEPFGQ